MDFTIKAGTELFHSTGEPFEDDDLNVGGFDKVLWTAMESAISQAYIPKAGSSVMTTTRLMWAPSDHKDITKFQREHLGLEYGDVKMEHGRAVSFRVVKSPVKFNYSDPEFERNMNAYVNHVLMSPPFGYEPSNRNSYDGDHHWRLYHDDINTIAPADFFMKGRLFILVPKRDLKLFDMTHGGSEGADLNDRDYYELDLFRELETKGYDGVKINDHAQTEEFGNFGHFSYGLFRHTLKDLKKEILKDVQHPTNLKNMYGAEKSNWHSQEYNKHRGLSEIIRRMIREELGHPAQK